MRSSLTLDNFYRDSLNFDVLVCDLARSAADIAFHPEFQPRQAQRRRPATG
jgi:hypothetical protein